MSQIYTPAHRRLQEQFGTEALADSIEAAVVADTLSADQEAFIQAQAMFFLSSLDEAGRPTVSYKGGSVGFVKVLSPTQLMFPSYDGNGMFYSMGNLSANPEVGLLFIDFQTPNRLRVQGRASLMSEGPALHAYPGADLVVTVDVDQAWVNCARYIHKMQPVDQSPYVPDAQGVAPVALWKRIQGMSALLNESDQQLVAQAGEITPEDYARKLALGEVI